MNAELIVTRFERDCLHTRLRQLLDSLAGIRSVLQGGFGIDLATFEYVPGVPVEIRKYDQKDIVRAIEICNSFLGPSD